jgi:uncharacterized protein
MTHLSPVARAAVVAALAVSAFAPLVQALDTSKLKPSGYVNDFARVIDPAAKQRLENYLGEVERSTGVQIAVVTVDSLDGDPVEDVANRLFREWGIGKKGKDEGMLLLLAIHDHKQRAEIGYGLEPIVTDGHAGEVLRGIRPILRQGNYGGALLAAAEEFGDAIAQAKGVDLAPLRPVRTGRRVAPRQSIPWPVFVFGFFFLMWLLGRIGRGGGGSGTGFLTGMILGNMMGRGSSGWGGGGFGGGGGGSGGGWGGFGGGDSGGGGASSDW